MNKNIFLHILFLLFSINVIGQTPGIQVSVSKKELTREETFKLVYEITGAGREFIPPGNLTGNFKLVSGPYQSQNMSVINGRMSSSLTVSYICQPINNGTYVIDPASVSIDGKRYESKSVTIRVSPPSKEKLEAEEKARKRSEEQAQKNAFIIAVASNKKPYQGEQFTLVYKLYNRLDITGLEDQTLPQYKNFFAHDIELDPNTSRSIEVIDGFKYEVYTLKKAILIPTTFGKTEISPMEFVINYRHREPGAVNTIFGPQYRYSNKKLKLKSKTIVVDIQPLPSPKPSNFNGAVGNFKLKTILQPDSVKSNEATTLEMKLTGKGNIELIELNNPEFPSDFDVFDPKIKSRINDEKGYLLGTKSFETLIIPRNSGTYTLKIDGFSYFSPKEKKYVSLPEKMLTLVVDEDETNKNLASGQNFVQGTEEIKKDIRFINTNSKPLIDDYHPWIGSGKYYFLMMVILLTGLIGGLVIRNKSKIHFLNNRRKDTELENIIKELSQINPNNVDSKQVYDGINRGIDKFIAIKYKVVIHTLTKTEINEVLTNLAFKPQDINTILSVLSNCEMSLYTPIQSHTATADLKTIVEWMKSAMK